MGDRWVVARQAAKPKGAAKKGGLESASTLRKRERERETRSLMRCSPVSLGLVTVLRSSAPFSRSSLDDYNHDSRVAS